MEVIGLDVDFFIHLDAFLGDIIESFGAWT
jgi:hypothetical protein